MKEDELYCLKCDTRLVLSKTTFTYLKHEFYADLPTCPVCGQVYVTEELAKGKMADVETLLEDK
jgi:transcription elongation factor Elf1